MNCTTSRHSLGAPLVTLLGTASVLAMANAVAFGAEAVVREDIPQNILITGSLIRGTAAVGVPVVNVSARDLEVAGALTIADWFKNFPPANVSSGELVTDLGARIERGAKVNLRALDGGNAVRSLMMVDGMRFPPQSNGLCAIDPSIIPSISLDRIDVLKDGSSATYGSDAIAGVINLILRRNYDGAQTRLRYTDRAGGGARYQVQQLWGRTWDGGQITLSYEWYADIPTKNSALSNIGVDHSPWGYDDRTPLGSATPGIITRAPFPSTAQQLGTACGFFNVPASGRPSTPSTCYSVPLGTGQDFRSDLNGGLGPTAPGSAPTLNWTTFAQDPNFAGPLNPSAGTRNEFNPYSHTWYNAAQQRNGGAITVDQRLTKDISFYGEGFYSNRRAQFLVPNFQAPSAGAANNALTLFAVPTFNPYYPSGTFCPASGAQPATCLPTNLRISYDITAEAPAFVNAYEVAARYQLGLNIALPAGWQGQLFYSMTYDSSYNHVTGSVNKNAVSAALGWTINPIAPNGTAPSFGSFTKPTSVPYLNLFCDPYRFQCNSATTLNYIDGYRSSNERFWVNEKGVKADGPLFDLPGGTVKMALGADLTSYRVNSVSLDNIGSNAHDLTINSIEDPEGRFVWAVFGQVNIPIFGDSNALPGFRKFELEASWRHDQYSDVKGTSNPKISFNWSPIDDLTIHGAWGSNFRAPGFGELSSVANVQINGWNLGNLANAQSTINACTSTSTAPPSAFSGAGKLQQAALAFNNAMAASGASGYTPRTGCVDSLLIPDPSTPYSQPASTIPSGANALAPMTAFADPGITAGVAGLLAPQGIQTNGAAAVSIPIRNFTGSVLLKPELTTNWSIGFTYTPSGIFRGLSIDATYYIIKINGVLRGFGNPNDARFQDPILGDVAFPSPADIGCPDLPNAVQPSIPIPANLVPSACAQWMTAALGLMSNPRSSVSPLAQTLVYWINDGATLNQGWQKLDGIDWNWSYDWDMGNIGAFSVGAIGTYYLHNKSVVDPGSAGPGSDVTDTFHTTVGSANAESRGVPAPPVGVPAYLSYRARLGWSKGPWSVIGFMDYRSHYYHTLSAPPNVNNQCVAAGIAIGGGTFPCPQNNYDNRLPPWYSFDLSIGYDTGEDPANDYLKNIGIQFIIQNIMDKHADYQYKAFTPGPFCTCDIARPNYGRQLSLIVTKTW